MPRPAEVERQLAQRHRARWLAGDRATIEETLAANGGTSLADPAQDTLVVRLVLAEVAARATLGEAPTPAEYSVRFPRLAVAIERSLAANVSALENLRRDSPVRPPRTVGSSGENLAASPMQSDADARRIGRYVLRELLGKGGFGAVWRAYDPSLDREVALKVPRPGAIDDERDLQRFFREARAAGCLRHPNIVPIFETGRAGEEVYISCGLIVGKTLHDWFAERGKKLPAAEAASLIAKLARALAYAHQRGVVHRDVKPQNVMLDAQREPVLMDFGLARRDAGEMERTMVGVRMGTPAYMSPEQAGGKSHIADGRSDQWSLGVMLYELLSGQKPFEAEGPALYVIICKQEAKPLTSIDPKIPRDLTTIVEQCLRKAPEKRYPDCGKLADDLGRFLRGEPVSVRPQHWVERAVNWSKSNQVVAGLSAAVAALSLLLLASFAWSLSAAWTVEKKGSQSPLQAVASVPTERPLAPPENSPTDDPPAHEPMTISDELTDVLPVDSELDVVDSPDESPVAEMENKKDAPPQVESIPNATALPAEAASAPMSSADSAKTVTQLTNTEVELARATLKSGGSVRVTTEAWPDKSELVASEDAFERGILSMQALTGISVVGDPRPLEMLDGAPNLRELSIEKLHWATAGLLRSLAKASQLESIRFSYLLEWSDDSLLAVLEPLREQLKSLTFVRVPMGDSLVHRLGQFPKLTALLLDRTQITDRAALSLAESTSLERVWLYEDTLSKRTLAQLRRARTGLHFISGSPSPTPMQLATAKTFFDELNAGRFFNAHGMLTNEHQRVFPATELERSWQAIDRVGSCSLEKLVHMPVRVPRGLSPVCWLDASPDFQVYLEMNAESRIASFAIEPRGDSGSPATPEELAIVRKVIGLDGSVVVRRLNGAVVLVGHDTAGIPADAGHIVAVTLTNVSDLSFLSDAKWLLRLDLTTSPDVNLAAFSNLHFLEIVDVKSDDCTAIASQLAKFGNRLRSLQLTSRGTPKGRGIRLSEFPRLRSLTISGGTMSDREYRSLDDMPFLTNFYLGADDPKKSLVTAETLNRVLKRPRIRSLLLHEIKLPSKFSAMIAESPMLNYLSVSGTFADKDIESLSANDGCLENLMISNAPRLTDRSITHFKRMPWLASLTLLETSVTNVDELKRGLPNCRVDVQGQLLDKKKPKTAK